MCDSLDYSVPDYSAPENFYHRYSATGPKHAPDETVFSVEYNTTFGNYQVVMFDASYVRSPNLTGWAAVLRNSRRE